MRFKNIFATSDQPGSLGDRFRNKRFGFLHEKLMQLPKPVRILDIGGLESFWANRGFGDNSDYDITILNLSATQTSFANMKGLAGDATDLKDIGTKEFDLVFSNSVIEHVYTWENQLKMAAEVTRVGKYHFIQTPNKHFPIEPHYVLPFFQYLPVKLKYYTLTKTRLSRLQKWDTTFAKQYIEEIRLLSFREMRELFPDSKFYKETFLGLTKSFSAYNL